MFLIIHLSLEGDTIEKFLDGVSKSAFAVKTLCFALWVIFVNLIIYSFSEFINYEITGYNTANFFETQAVSYSVFKVLSNFHPYWIISSYVVVMLLELGVYKLATKKSIYLADWVRFFFAPISVVVAFQVNTYFGFILLSIYTMLIYSFGIQADIQSYVGETDNSKKINIIFSVLVYSLLFLGGTLCFLWHAASSYERLKVDFAKNVCDSIKVIAVLDKSNVKHVGWHLNSSANFITIKEKVKDNFYEMVSLSNAEVVSVQSFSLDFKAERGKAFLECRDI